MLFRRLALVLILTGTAGSGMAGVTRVITAATGNQISVRLAWSFDAGPSACLIVDEDVPAGWSLVEFQCTAGGDVKVRNSGASFSFAIGLQTAAASQGALTYLLEPAANAAPLAISGACRTAFNTTDVTVKTGGDSVAPLAPPTTLTGFEIWAAAMGLPAGADPLGDADADGFSNNAELIAQTDPLDAASRFRVTAWHLAPAASELNLSWFGATNRTVLLDWRPLGGSAADWRCIWTSTPPDRAARSLAAPAGCVVSEKPPITPQPGFYRLRVAEP